VNAAASNKAPLSPSALSAARQLSDFIRAAPSATAALQAWCTERTLGTDRISARLLDGTLLEAPPPALLGALDGTQGERVLARKVALCCGELMLSIARIWYLADRLPAPIADQLVQSTVPFGYAVAPLCPQRRTISTKIYASIDAPDIEPDTVVEHQAVVAAGSGTILAVVQERYQRALLGAEYASAAR